MKEKMKTRIQPEKNRRLGPLLREAPDQIRKLVIAWVAAALVLYAGLPAEGQSLEGLASLEAMSFPMLLLITMGGMICLVLLGKRWQNAQAERCLLVGLYGFLMVLAVSANNSKPFLQGGLLILGMMVVYAVFGWNSQEPAAAAQGKPEWPWAVAAAAAGIWFFLFIGDWTVSRYLSFSNSTFDFGIFSQAFYYLKTTLVPYTTVERTDLLSHFAVHVSPILYTILPFYALFPEPATLQVVQAALMASAVIPGWLLGKHYGFPGLPRLLLCLMLLLSPAYGGGVSYDFHENCFLTPLLLWLFYGIARRSKWQIGLFALLTLMVKEDAAVYILVVGLWLLVQGAVLPRSRRWNCITGGSLMAAALLWFLAATGYLDSQGDGVMTWRYSNFLYGDSESLLTAVKAVLMSPMKALFECMDPEKLEYWKLTLLPLAGLPLLTRRYERLILLIPYVLINLLSDYSYQHDIMYQYSFGSLAFLLMLSMLNARDILDAGREDLCGVLLIAAVVMGAMLFGEHIRPEAEYYVDLYDQYQAHYEERAELLEEIPEYVPVAATTYLAPHLSQRDVLYDIRYCSREQVLSAEYVLIDPGIAGCLKKYATEDKSGYEGITQMLKAEGFVLVKTLGTVLEVYQRS